MPFVSRALLLFSMQTVSKTLRLIRKQAQSFTVPSVTEIAFAHDPYLVLISCILSLRTKDKTTLEASRRLFAVADNPKAMSKLSKSLLQKLIYPVGFYHTKAPQLKTIAQYLTKNSMPQTREGLMAFKGVGRKTANVVLGNAFQIPGLVVDTHVIRLSNRMGLARGQDAVDLEKQLQKIIPENQWTLFGHLFISHGRAVCSARKPKCETCFLKDHCPQKGVK